MSKRNEQHPAVTGHHSPVQAELMLSPNVIDQDSQIGRILSALAKGQSLNKFEAEDLGDHCLNTTISVLRSRYGIVAERRREKVLGYRKRPSLVMRYWLSQGDVKRSYKLLGWSL